MTSMMLSRDRLHNAVTEAVRAPSSHNTQPWIFAIEDEHVDVRADRTRGLAQNDRDDRELAISCGAALLNLRVALAASGVSAAVRLLPDPVDRDLLGRVHILDQSPPIADVALASAIRLRQTYRRPFDTRPVSCKLWNEIEAAATEEGASLVAVPAEARTAVAELVAAGDKAQFADARWRRELASWMHPRRAGDGLTYPRLTLPITRFVVSNFNVGAAAAKTDRKLAMTAPVLAILSTSRDQTRDWLSAGMALERSLLVAAANGVLASFLNQPCQVSDLRRRLGKSLSLVDVPQVVLRLGYPAAPVTPAPRRPVDAVIRTNHHPSE